MKPVTSASMPKKPFNLTLSESTVEQARHYTSNLSATVDTLLIEFVSREKRALEEKRALYAKVSAAWNTLDETHGGVGDEHSPL